MSDTDDTDVLLLIPPDFFLVNSDSEEFYNETSCDFCDCEVVEGLISHVNELESRMSKIEGAELGPSSFGSNSTIIPFSDMSEVRNDYIPTSAKSTPQKPRNKPYLSSLPSTPSTERPGSAKYRRPPRFTTKLPPRHLKNQSTDDSSPEKTDNKTVLGEIDTFLNNVKTIASKHEPLNKPELSLKDESERRFSQLNLKDVNRLLHQIESQQNYMDLRDQQVESIYENKNFWQCGDTKNSVPDLGFGMRDVLYSEDNLPKSDSPSNSETYQTVFEQKPVQSKSSPAVQTNIPDRIRPQTKLLEKNAKPSENPNFDSSFEDSLPRDTTKIAKSVPTNLISKFNHNNSQVPHSSVSSINLFSLADIWNSNGKGAKISEKEMQKLLPKLEEEKCRRKHCEKLIQELQMKILEMQQRLAVAVQVDSAKDEAILRFHEAWEKVANRWKSLESERNILSQKVFSIEQRSSLELAEAAQKVVQYELEMSKAREKATSLEQERNDFFQKLNSLKIELKASHENLRTISKENEQLSEKINHLEKESSASKKLLLETQNEVSRSKNIFLNCQNELSVLKESYVKLEIGIKDKQSTISDLEKQKNTLQITLDTVQKNESQLQQQIKTIQDESERAKHDFRNFYQQQVEILVKDKLKEFQEQLENAEKSLQEELHLREQVIAKTAAKQMQKLSDKHRLEVQLIEEKHKEENQLYELKFKQMKQQIILLENKLEGYQARRTNIAQELHNIMEQQWLEALRIINNSKSPETSSPRQETQKELQDLKNMLASKEKLAALAKEEENHQHQKFDDTYAAKFRTKSTDNIPFRSLPEVYETPVSSKHKIEEQSDVQKYIKMLLDKLPKNTADKLSSRESSTSDFADSSWHQLQTQVTQQNEKVRDQRTGKPPWK